MANLSRNTHLSSAWKNILQVWMPSVFAQTWEHLICSLLLSAVHTRVTHDAEHSKSKANSTFLGNMLETQNGEGERNKLSWDRKLTHIPKTWQDFYEMLMRNSSQEAHYGPEPASKIQIFHKLLCISLFLKKIKEGERNSWFRFGKEGIFSFKIENLWYATYVCCCLGKKNSCGENFC